jgi:MFS family permease
MGAMAGAYLALFPLLPELQRRHGLSTSALGLLGAVGFLGAVVGELLVAPRVDRGRGPQVVAGSVAVMAVSLAGVAASTQLWQFAALRAMSGVAFGAFVPAMYAYAVRSAPERAGEELGRLQAAELVGLAIGPLAAALAVAPLGPGRTLVVVGLVLLAVLPLVRTLRPAGSSSPDGGSDRAARRVPSLRRVLPLDLLALPGMAAAVLITVAFTIPIGAYDSLWPRFMADLGATELVVGATYTVFAIPFAVLARRAGGYADRVGGLRAAWAGLAVMLPCLVAYGFVRNPLVVAGLGFLESGGQAFVSVASAAAVAHAVPAERAAAGQGLARSIGTVVAAAVAAAAGPVYGRGGPEALFMGAAAATAAAMVAATVLARRRRAADPGRGVGGPPQDAVRGGADVVAGSADGRWLPVAGGQG